MNLKMKLASILLIIFSVLPHLNAQKCFLEGSITSHENITRRGMIDYRNWKFNPRVIKFLPGDDDIALTHDPSTIKTFTVNNEKFISELVSIDRTPETYDQLKYDARGVIIYQQVFLRVLVEGATSLYCFNDQNSGMHFYVKKGSEGKITELKQYHAIADIEGEVEVVLKDEYKDQLAGIMSDCSMILPLVHLADYNKKDLTGLVEEYNKCMNTGIDYIAEIPSYDLEFSLLAGVSLFSIDFRSTVEKDLTAAEFSYSINPSASIGLNIVFPFARKTFSIYNELGISYYRSAADVLWYENENEYENVKINLGAVNLQLLTAIKYTYPARGVRPFAYAGMVNIFSTGIRNDKTSVSYFYGNENIHDSEAIPGYRQYSPGLAAGIGVKYRNTAIDIRYERPSRITNAIEVESGINIVFLLFSYSF